MKKIFFSLFIFIFSFILINNVDALKMSDGSELLNNDFSYERLEKYVSEKGFDYWKDLLNSDYFAIITNSFNNASFFGNIYLISSPVDFNSKKISYSNYFSCLNDCSIYTLSFDYIKNHDEINLNDFDSFSSVNSSSGFLFNDVISSFNFYKFGSSSEFLFEANFGNLVKFYTVKFNIPKGAILELKNENGNIVNSNNNIFSLESGKYYYSVKKSDLYISKENIELIVNSDLEIDVELESKLNLTNYSNIFSKFYNYLGLMVPKIFNIENPFFLVVFGVSIIVFIVLLIIKFLKGRF